MAFVIELWPSMYGCYMNAIMIDVFCKIRECTEEISGSKIYMITWKWGGWIKDRKGKE